MHQYSNHFIYQHILVTGETLLRNRFFMFEYLADRTNIRWQKWRSHSNFLFIQTNCKLLKKMMACLLSISRLPLTRGLVVIQQPGGHSSERPAQAGTSPVGLRTADAAGLPFASLLILRFSTGQKNSSLLEMLIMAFHSLCKHSQDRWLISTYITGRCVQQVGRMVTVRGISLHHCAGLFGKCRLFFPLRKVILVL